MQIDADSYAQVRYESETVIKSSSGIDPKDVDFDLNSMLKVDDLFKISGSFDTMKRAIEFLMKNQRNMEALIKELLTAGPVTVEHTDAPAGDNDEDAARRAREAENAKKLQRDFDRRLTELEEAKAAHDNKLESLEIKNGRQDEALQKTNDHVDDLQDQLRKLENEIKGLKLAAGQATNSEGGGVDNISALIQMINEMGDEIKTDCSKKFVLLTDYEEHVAQNAEEHKAFEKDINGACIRLKMLEDWKNDKEDKDNGYYKKTDQNDKILKKCNDDIASLIFEISQLKRSSSGMKQMDMPPMTQNTAVSLTGDIEARLLAIEENINDLQIKKADKADLESLTQRVDDLDSQRKQDGHKLQNLADALAKLQKDVDAIDAARLRKEVAQVQSQLLGLVKQDDLKDIRTELARLRSMLVDIRDDFKSMQDKVQRLEDLIDSIQKQTKENFDGVHHRCEQLNVQIVALQKLLQRLNEKVDAGGSNHASKAQIETTKNSKGESGLGDSLRPEFEAFVAKMQRTVADHQYQLDEKATKADLAALEARLRALIEQMMKQSGGTSDADLQALRKKLGSLEKTLKRVYDAVAELQQTKVEEDDAMFTKKYIGPVECASCEKGLVNLQGKQADKVHWNKLPFREPGDRIARYGKGFSQYLNQAAQQEQLMRTINEKRGSMIDKMNQDSGQLQNNATRRGDMYNTTSMFMSPQPQGSAGHIQKATYFNSVHNQSSELLDQSTNMESKQHYGQTMQAEVRSTSLMEPSNPANQINVNMSQEAVNMHYAQNQNSNNNGANGNMSLPDVHQRSPSKHR